MRSLWVEVLPALGITGAGVQASLISLVHRNLGAIVIAAVTTVITMATVVTIAAIVAVTTVVAVATIVTIATVVVVASVAAIVAVITVVIADPLIPVASPIAISILVIDPITITTLVLCFPIISIVSILSLRCRAGRGVYAENKREAGNRPADSASENIFHISPFSLSRMTLSKLEAAGLQMAFTLIPMHLTRKAAKGSPALRAEIAQISCCHFSASLYFASHRAFAETVSTDPG